ncbi:MAG TPA: glycosyltransferase family 4 protein [Candidatus Dormibacteraeota bacterium]
MRLLVLVHGYPPAVGGVEFAVRDLAERLVARHGFDVTVLTTNAFTNENFRDRRLPTVPIRADEVQNGVRVRRFAVDTRWAPPLRVAQGVAWRLRLPGNDRLRTLYQGPIAPALRRAAAATPADAVFAASFPLNHLNYAFRPDRLPVVLLGAVHPEDAWGYHRPNLLALSRRAAATVALTPGERRWLVDHGAPEERTHCIPEGIDPATATLGAFRAERGLGPGDFVIAYVGQQGSHKGIDVLIRALPRLPDARLVIAGSVTPYSAEIRRLARGDERVILLDGVDERLKASIMADCDVFASPSAYESFGITTLEAWAQSKPVVLGDGPAQRELTDGGRLGVLVPYGQVEPLAGALQELAASPARRRELGEAGRRRLLERYTLDAVVDRYHELFVQLAASR